MSAWQFGVGGGGGYGRGISGRRGGERRGVTLDRMAD